MAFCSITPGANTGAGTYIGAAAMRPQACRRPLLSAGATSVQRCNFTIGHVSPLISSRRACRRTSSPAQLMCFDFSPVAVLSFTPVGDFEMPVSLTCTSLTAWEEAGVHPERTNAAQERPPGTNSESPLLRGDSANHCSTMLPMLNELLLNLIRNNEVPHDGSRK